MRLMPISVSDLPGINSFYLLFFFLLYSLPESSYNKSFNYISHINSSVTFMFSSFSFLYLDNLVMCFQSNSLSFNKHLFKMFTNICMTAENCTQVSLGMTKFLLI